jgi:DNA-binding CsgD family transcriptional regulator
MITVGSDDLSVLSPREMQVMTHVGNGLAAGEIGKLLFISPKTAESHMLRIRRKLGVDSACHLRVLAAIKLGAYRVGPKVKPVPVKPATPSVDVPKHLLRRESELFRDRP